MANLFRGELALKICLRHTITIPQDMRQRHRSFREFPTQRLPVVNARQRQVQSRLLRNHPPGFVFQMMRDTVSEEFQLRFGVMVLLYLLLAVLAFLQHLRVVVEGRKHLFHVVRCSTSPSFQ